MSSMVLYNVIGLVALVALVVVFFRLRSRDHFDEIAKKRKTEAKLIDRADYVEGITHFPVVLSLTEKAIFYENVELAAHIDLENIDEVEYDDELATGKEVSPSKVLRLRSHGHTFEFVIDRKTAPKWSTALPVHHFDEPGKVHAS
jgi:hypothetical protein